MVTWLRDLPTSSTQPSLLSSTSYAICLGYFEGLHHVPNYFLSERGCFECFWYFAKLLVSYYSRAFLDQVLQIHFRCSQSICEPIQNSNWHQNWPSDSIVYCLQVTSASCFVTDAAIMKAVNLISTTIAATAAVEVMLGDTYYSASRNC